MYFLIRYNRPAGQIVSLERFAEDQAQLASETRLELELELNRRQIADEVVILHAVDEEAIRRTHGRYFLSVSELRQRMQLVLAAAAAH